MKGSKNKRDAQESLNFIIEHMATKDDVRDIVHEEVGNVIEKKDLATKEDIKGIVSSAHNRLDQEVENRKQLEVRVTKLEHKVLS